MDKIMHKMGLLGSHLLLDDGFGCNVPAVMATRTFRTEKPLYHDVGQSVMCCSARSAYIFNW
jgi:ferrous iron transport protein B